MSKLKWECLPFDQLSTDVLYAILRLRSEVFVVEQDCVYQDIDNFDQKALHVMGTKGGKLVCYSRLLSPGMKYPGAAIGRVIIRKSARGKGHGQELMNLSMQYCAGQWPDTPITLSAQHHLEKFYASLGFATMSDSYMEDGIPHVEMMRP